MSTVCLKAGRASRRTFALTVGLVTLAALLCTGRPAAADEIELQDGRKLTGLVQSQDAAQVVFRVVYPNGGTLDRTFPAATVKAIRKMPLPEPAKLAAKDPAPKTTPPADPPPRIEVAPKPTPPPTPPQPEDEEEDPDAPPANVGGEDSGAAPATQPGAHSRAEIDAQIDKAGKEPPAWWDSVKLNFPPTLDLTWPQRPTGPWDPQKNVNQYYINIINPNPPRHQEGCKLMHHLMAVNKGNADVQLRGMTMLGRIYGIYLHDYARGAFWYRKAAKAASLNANDTANLVFYYWKLGGKEMAMAELARARQYCAQTIRVLGGMGELSKALDLARRLAGSYPEDGFLAAGDACRFNGRYSEAVQWYQQVLALKPANPSKPGRLPRYQARAKASADAARLFEQIDLNKIADGTYRSESVGFRGPVKVELVVKGGRITDVKVIETKEDWPLNAQVAVPAQIIEKQSVQSVDTVSGATVTSEAVINASAKALAGAARK